MAWPPSRLSDGTLWEMRSDWRGKGDAPGNRNDIAVRSIRTSHGRIAFSTTAGAGIPLVLLHGRARCKAEFRQLMTSSVGEERTMIAIDLPGHGGSAAASDPDHTYTLEGYADAVIEVLEHLGIERAGVLGRSVGGHVGLQIACAFPGFAGLFVALDEGTSYHSQLGIGGTRTRDLPGERRASRRDHRRKTRLAEDNEALGPALRLVSQPDDRYRRLPLIDSAPTTADLAAVRHAIGAGRPFMRSCRKHPSLPAAPGDTGNQALFYGSDESLLRFLSQVDSVSLDVPLLGLCLSG